MIDALARILAGGDASARCRAITLVRRLALTAELADLVVGLVREEDVRVASAATTLLPETNHTERDRLVEIALARTDDRIRANAIEVLPRVLAPAEAARVLPDYVDHEDNRCRANAVRAMLRTAADEAGRALRTMLRDARPRHRVSAIWVARRGRVGEVRHEVERLAVDDPVPEIRVRAWSAQCQLRELPAGESP